MPLFSISPLGACLSQAIWGELPRGGISLVEVYEGGGKSVISVCKKAQNGQQMHFLAGKVEKTFQFCDSLDTVHLQQLKGCQGFN